MYDQSPIIQQCELHSVVYWYGLVNITQSVMTSLRLSNAQNINRSTCISRPNLMVQYIILEQQIKTNIFHIRLYFHTKSYLHMKPINQFTVTKWFNAPHEGLVVRFTRHPLSRFTNQVKCHPVSNDFMLWTDDCCIYFHHCL